MDAESPQRFPINARKAALAPSRWGMLAAGMAALSAGFVLYFFDPAAFGFYPRCALHEITGWQCPGCGGLRAMHQLLHGHLGAAWELNPLVFILAPAAIWLGWRQWRGAGLPAGVRPVYGWAAGIALLLFGVWRNLR